MCLPATSKVYVSGNDPVQAKALAEKVAAGGHKVVSTWHDEDGPKVDPGDRATWSARWGRNKEAIEKAGVFVMFASPERVPGGKFVELGYALGRADDEYGDGKYIAVIGDKPENGMAANDDVTYFRDEQAFLNSL